MLTARVSTIEAFRYWRTSGNDWSWFLDKCHQAESDRMKAGTALHEWLKNVPEGEFYLAQNDGYDFVFDGEYPAVFLPPVREERREKNYGGLTVTGKADAITGNCITDYKFSLSFPKLGPESYAESFQWRLYLSLFEKDRFEHVIFDSRQLREREYRIKEIHVLRQNRYPDLEKDCEELCAEFLRVANHHPELADVSALGLEDIHEFEDNSEEPTD